MASPPQAESPQSSLPRIAGLAALVMAWLIILGWAVTLPGLRASGAVDASAGTMLLLPGRVAASLALVATFVAYWVRVPDARRGLPQVVIGLFLHWGWWLFVTSVNLWGIHPWVLVVPRLLGIEAWSPLMVNLGMDALAALLVFLGGVAILEGRPY